MIYPTPKDRGKSVIFREFHLDGQSIVGRWLSGEIVSVGQMVIEVMAEGERAPRFVNRVDLSFAEDVK